MDDLVDLARDNVQDYFRLPLHKLAENALVLTELAKREDLDFDDREQLELLREAMAGRIDRLFSAVVAIRARRQAVEAIAGSLAEAEERIMGYIEQATVRAGGTIKGTLATAEMKKPGGQDPLEVADVHAVPDLFKKYSITIRAQLPATDKEMLRYWQSVIIGRDMPENEKELSIPEIDRLEKAIKVDVEKAEIKKLIKGGANIAGVVMMERQKVLHIKELKMLEKAEKANKKLLEKENDDE